MKVYTEGVFTAILKAFSFGRIVDAIKKYGDVTKTDQFKSDFKDYQEAVKEYNKKLEDLCTNFPNNRLCKDFKKTGK